MGHTKQCSVSQFTSSSVLWGLVVLGSLYPMSGIELLSTAGRESTLTLFHLFSSRFIYSYTIKTKHRFL